MGAREFPGCLLFLGEVGLPPLLWLPQNVKAQASHTHPSLLPQVVASLVSPEGDGAPGAGLCLLPVRVAFGMPPMGVPAKPGDLSQQSALSCSARRLPPILPCTIPQRDPPPPSLTTQGASLYKVGWVGWSFLSLRCHKLQDILQSPFRHFLSPQDSPSPTPGQWSLRPRPALSTLHDPSVTPLAQSEPLQGRGWPIPFPSQCLWSGRELMCFQGQILAFCGQWVAALLEAGS